MKELTENQGDTNSIYNEFKQLQQEWNDIKLVPANKANELWKNYQHYTEKFYDMVKLNNEFREYDFKKNLEQKIINRLEFFHAMNNKRNKKNQLIVGVLVWMASVLRPE